VNVDTYRQLCAWGVRGYTMTIRYSLLAVGDLEGVDQHDTRRPLPCRGHFGAAMVGPLPRTAPVAAGWAAIRVAAGSRHAQSPREVLMVEIEHHPQSVPVPAQDEPRGEPDRARSCGRSPRQSVLARTSTSSKAWCRRPTRTMRVMPTAASSSASRSMSSWSLAVAKVSKDASTWPSRCSPDMAAPYGSWRSEEVGELGGRGGAVPVQPG
jgi:hypothetical protein